MESIPQTIIDATEFLPVGFAIGRCMAEIDALAAMLADPPAMFSVAQAAGLGWPHFAEPDTRIIFCAIGADHARGALAVLKLARIGLKRAGYWDDRLLLERPGMSLFWSDQTLDKLASAEPDPDVTRWAAQRLITVHERAETATAAYMNCFTLVDGEVANG
jgi:hypothetical protein